MSTALGRPFEQGQRFACISEQNLSRASVQKCKMKEEEKDRKKAGYDIEHFH